MTEAVIVDAVRTPIGRRNGALSGVHPADLSALVLQALAERNQLDPATVDDVLWGCVSQVGDQAMNIGRYGVLGAGWPESVPATTIDRQCGSSQQATAFAHAAVVAGHYDIVVAGGVESMSRVPMFSTVQGGHPEGAMVKARYGDRLVPQGVGAEMIADKWGLTKERLDSIAVRSHERAAAAIDSGAFKEQIVPVTTPDGTVVDTDEGVRRGTSLEALSTLKTPFKENGKVTAGNASQISDGASAVLIMSDTKARELGLRPMARIVSSVVVGADPVTMLTGPIPATRKILGKTGLGVSDIGAFEVNEAFASVIGAWEDELGPDTDRVNPNGGAIALGHPLGCSGARVMTTLVHHMRDNGLRYGLQTICEGGGMANATILELL
ncbi:thiolase family protein [Streptomyces sp. NPDC046805]|uniref:thiolase family protein n=1 Tax=Streptomyces sp. NPDC046805 TaxID=3155134 RepID=UPI0033EF033A